VERELFGGWDSLLRALVVGVLAYVALVLALRIAGKRTLSKLNAFDLVVTVALGSILATILLSSEVSLASGVLAFALLIFLQFVVTWSSVRIPWIRKAVTGEPRMLMYRGEILPDALKRARVTEAEIRAAVRSSGFSDMAAPEAVVLETDGSFSVVGGGDAGGPSSLSDVTAKSLEDR
jgi:uncharacterized membrane protein YcaP (DUF421 family)